MVLFNSLKCFSTIAYLLGTMQGIYTGTQVCIDKTYNPCKGNDVLWARTSLKHQNFLSNNQSDTEDKDRICLFGEPEIEQIMTGSTTNDLKFSPVLKSSNCFF